MPQNTRPEIDQRKLMEAFKNPKMNPNLDSERENQVQLNTSDYLKISLHAVIDLCNDTIAEKQGREIALVKTKLQEALFWLNEVK